MPLPALTFPPWLPGWLSYTSLLLINSFLPLITVVSIDGGVTGLDALLVGSNALAGITLIAMVIYKMLMRTWVCNDAKRDRPVLFCVTLLDVCAAVAWSVRLDRSGFCAKQQGNNKCHTALIGVAVTFSWIAVAIAYCSAVWADHGAKKQKRKPSPLPLYVPNPSTRPVISAPKLIDAGQFNESVRDDVDIKFGGFTPIPI